MDSFADDADDEALEFTPRTSETIGPWRLVDTIGRGAWSTVYLARPVDRKPGASGCYAVKVLNETETRNDLALATLRREALVGLTVMHSHVVSVVAAHVHEPPYYLTAPFLAGETLRERIDDARRSDRAMPVAPALWIVRQIATGLDALHKAGWLHGDVKPSNIIVSPSMHATLIDLGFCRPLAAGPCSVRPFAGTCDYLAPEMSSVAAACGPAADLYSLGVTLFEMLTGRLPFHGRDAGEVASKHRQEPFPNVLAHRSDLPPAVCELLKRLVAKQPLRRPDIAETLDCLYRLEVKFFALRDL